ncbi:MAG: hypothetical protein WC719_04685 [Patescibacteria group bacterium]|jgi:hypothetical protein
MAQKKIIAISEADFERFGCSACGGKEGIDLNSSTLGRMRECPCGVKTIILSDGVKSSPISTPGGVHFPSLSKHPLDGKS